MTNRKLFKKELKNSIARTKLIEKIEEYMETVLLEKEFSDDLTYLGKAICQDIINLIKQND